MTRRRSDPVHLSIGTPRRPPARPPPRREQFLSKCPVAFGADRPTRRQRNNPQPTNGRNHPLAHPALVARPNHPSRCSAGALNAPMWGPPNQKRVTAASSDEAAVTLFWLGGPHIGAFNAPAEHREGWFGLATRAGCASG